MVAVYLIPPLKALMIFLGPHPDYDREIVTMGEKYVRFFKQGIDNELSNGALENVFTPHLQYAGAYGVGGSGSSININISGNIIGEDEWVRENLLPIMQDQIMDGETSVLRGDQNVGY